ncbi:MAG TPA: M56 family metallopeptidase [Methylomirabilota bacterium]|nr:M56 family metallopeptidase [Methylomirabilota bacterium]
MTTIPANEVLTSLATGLLQGLVLVGFVAIGLRCTPRLNAATRHLALFVALLLVALLPLAHLARAMASAEPALVTDAEPEAPAPEALPEAEPFFEHLPAEEELRVDFAAAEATSAEPLGLADAAQADPEPLPTSAERVQWTLPLSNRAAVIVLGLWAALALFRFIRLGHECRALNSIKRASQVAPPETAAMFDHLCRELSISRTVTLRLTDQIAIPLAAGGRNPVVLLPANLAASLPAENLQQILCHELAHVARGDDWLNLIQQTLRAAFFFHPGALWLSRRLSVEREIAADDWVIHSLKAVGPRASYALFLTEFASGARGPSWTAAPAGWAQKHQITERVNMLINTRRNASPKVARLKTSALTAAAVIAAALTFTHAPRLVVAQDVAPAAVSADAVATGSSSASAAASNAASSDPAAVSPPKIKAAAGGALTLTAPAPAPTPLVGPVATPATLHLTPPAVAVTVPAAPAAPGFIPAQGPRAKGHHNESIEERLARLEATVQSLIHSRSGKANDLRAAAPGAKMAPPHEKDLAHIDDMVKREMERAERDMARAHETHKKHSEDRHAAEVRRNATEHERMAAKEQRKALNHARRTLEQQLRELERQLEKIDREEAQLDRRDEEAEKKAERKSPEEGKDKAKEPRPF